ncbi:MFS transporter [Gluconobacter oxydans]|uniref:MFS transporter n=1 Tax=Gluconobacter oxydans TaxID=442 RepID=UPI0039E927A2
MTQQTFPAQPAVPVHPEDIIAKRRTQALGASLGNFLEFYNFIIYAFFTPMIAHTFFRTDRPGFALVYSLLTFASGYLIRPLGAVLFGLHTRRHGAGATLSLTFLLMGAGSLLLAVTPGYDIIGPWGTGLLIVARLIQGFAEGGDVGPSTDLLFVLSESGPARAAYILMQPATQYMASLAGVLFGLLMAATLPEETLYGWAWRIPFLFGVLIIPVGFWLRRSFTAAPISSSPAQEIPHQAAGPTLDATRLGRLATLCLFLFVASGAIQTYIRTFGVSYAVSILHLPPTVAKRWSPFFRQGDKL